MLTIKPFLSSSEVDERCGKRVVGSVLAGDQVHFVQMDPIVERKSSFTTELAMQSKAWEMSRGETARRVVSTAVSNESSNEGPGKPKHAVYGQRRGLPGSNAEFAASWTLFGRSILPCVAGAIVQQRPPGRNSPAAR